MMNYNTIFSKGRLEKVGTIQNLDKKKDYIRQLDLAFHNCTKRMLLYLIIEHHCVESKELLVEHLEIPNNLTDKETVAYLQLLGD